MSYTDQVTPYSLGEEAFHDKRKRSECPYTDTFSFCAASDWREGWDRAQQDDRDARRILGR